MFLNILEQKIFFLNNPYLFCTVYFWAWGPFRPQTKHISIVNFIREFFFRAWELQNLYLVKIWWTLTGVFLTRKQIMATYIWFVFYHFLQIKEKYVFFLLANLLFYLNFVDFCKLNHRVVVLITKQTVNSMNLGKLPCTKVKYFSLVEEKSAVAVK
jgi:hypothetical protein